MERIIFQKIEATGQGKNIMKIVCDYLERYVIVWKTLVGCCFHTAPAVLGSLSGLTNICAREEFTTLPEGSSKLKKVVNAVKSSSLYHRTSHLKFLACQGNTLARLYKLEEEPNVFFIETKVH